VSQEKFIIGSQPAKKEQKNNRNKACKFLMLLSFCKRFLFPPRLLFGGERKKRGFFGLSPHPPHHFEKLNNF
jgi:hypothetical protein